jgi:hypothetical protein
MGALAPACRKGLKHVRVNIWMAYELRSPRSHPVLGACRAVQDISFFFQTEFHPHAVYSRSNAVLAVSARCVRSWSDLGQKRETRVDRGAILAHNAPLSLANRA